VLDGFADLLNSTVSNNDNRGIVSLGGATTTLTGCIVANNTSTTPDHDLDGTFYSFGYNLVETPDSAVINDASNPGTNITGQDPKLGPLQDNGGPTKTQALASDSPALDKGKVMAADPGGNILFRDQRGASRSYDFTSAAPAVGGDNSDIGAFELNPVAESVTDKATNEDTPLAFDLFVGDQTVSSLTATSSDKTLVPDANISFTGNGPTRTVHITPAANQYGSTTINISLTGSQEGAVTRSARARARRSR
jgi:hypothetical protein